MRESYEDDEDEGEDEATPASIVVDTFYAQIAENPALLAAVEHASVRSIGPTTVEIDQITIRDGFRGRGHANQLMATIIDLADRHRVWLTLEPAANMGRPVSTEGLRRWYSTLGFVDGAGKNMNRRPKSTP